MAGRDNRINATLGSVTRNVGSDAQDVRALQRRREEAEKRQAPPPKRTFAQVLGAHAAATQAKVGAAAPAAGTPPARPPVRGKQRLLRG